LGLTIFSNARIRKMPAAPKLSIPLITTLPKEANGCDKIVKRRFSASFSRGVRLFVSRAMVNIPEDHKNSDRYAEYGKVPFFV
jgi:hypothetical protein